MPAVVATAAIPTAATSRSPKTADRVCCLIFPTHQPEIFRPLASVLAVDGLTMAYLIPVYCISSQV